MTTRICLNAIVRNESKNILRMLRSVAPIIDCWSITDTGSTDDTREKIESFFMMEQIRGNLWTQPFVDFATTRNWSLDRSENSFLAEHFDYHLLVDADMVWVGVLDKEALTENAYMIRQKDVPSGAEYDNIRLVKRGIGAQYVGVTHEYLDVPGRCDTRLCGGMFIDFADGANRPGKFERDIALLEAEVKSNPEDARAVFYLAQSYRDAGRLEEAASYYRKRAQMLSTWEEERWYALLMYARCCLSLGWDREGLRQLQEAHIERSWRKEPLRDLSRYYLDKANAITDTRDDILFLEP